MGPKRDNGKLKCGYCPDSCSGKAWMQCNQCEFWYHREFNYLEAQTKDGNMGWMCEKCHKVNKMIKAEVSMLAGRVKDLETRASDTDGKIEGVIEEAGKMEGRVAALEENCNNDRLAESVFKEIKEREHQQTNLIVHGLEEPGNNVAAAEDRKEADMENMQELANVIGVDVVVKEAVKVARRLGAKKGAESRPLLLVFKNREDREKFLDKAPKLDKAGEPWKQVNVVVDLTAKQRQEDNDVKK